jgi:hypothetical protein
MAGSNKYSHYTNSALQSTTFPGSTSKYRLVWWNYKNRVLHQNNGFWIYWGALNTFSLGNYEEKEFLMG